MSWLVEVIAEFFVYAIGEFLTSRQGRPFLYVLLILVAVIVGCWIYFHR